MNLKQLMEGWQELDNTPLPEPRIDDIIAACRKRVRKFRWELLFSDILEIGVGLAMVWVWAGVFPRHFPRHTGMMYVGAAAILFICVFLAGARILRYRNDKPAFVSVSDEISRQLYAVNQRIWLLRHLIWWYLLPGTVAAFTVWYAVAAEILPKLSSLEEGRGTAYLILFLAEAFAVLFSVGVDVGVYFLNQRALRQYLLPLKEDLTKILRDLKVDNGQ
jgi:hypothetical protein